MGAEEGSETADDEKARILRVAAAKYYVFYHDGGIITGAPSLLRALIRSKEGSEQQMLWVIYLRTLLVWSHHWASVLCTSKRKIQKGAKRTEKRKAEGKSNETKRGSS
jgi:hypothetical protein